MGMSYLGIFRHGEYGAEATSPLNKYGERQVILLRKGINDILRHHQNPRIMMACGQYPRAYQSAWMINSDATRIVMTVLTKGNWTPRDEEQALDLLERLERHTLAESASCVIIVGHGNSPAFLARAALRRQGHPIPQMLEKTDVSKTACGYFVNIIQGKVSAVEVDTQQETWNVNPGS